MGTNGSPGVSVSSKASRERAGLRAAWGDATPWLRRRYQVYYLAKGRGVMWYDPVFQVERLDGTRVWRRRHYRVRRGGVRRRRLPHPAQNK